MLVIVLSLVAFAFQQNRQAGVLAEQVWEKEQALRALRENEDLLIESLRNMGEAQEVRRDWERRVRASLSDRADEITSPALRDVSLEWKGVRVARVYPESLPNLPAGRQQIILGRYLPEAANVQATLRVRGTMDGEAVTSELPVTFLRFAQEFQRRLAVLQ